MSVPFDLVLGRKTYSIFAGTGQRWKTLGGKPLNEPSTSRRGVNPRWRGAPRS
jgi:hypothetical protein